MDLWLDGVRLQDGVDYGKEEGSPSLTIRTNVLGDEDVGTHTLSMEFREGDRELSTMKRAAQNYTVTGTARPTASSTPSWTPSSGF